MRSDPEGRLYSISYDAEDGLLSVVWILILQAYCFSQGDGEFTNRLMHRSGGS